MEKSAFKRQIWISVLLLITFMVTLVPEARASGLPEHDTPVFLMLIDTLAAFFIFVFGIKVVYKTRGGFLSIAFILITVGISVGWVAKLVFEFLTDSSIIATTVDVVDIAEAIGGIILAVGFIMLSQNLAGKGFRAKSMAIAEDANKSQLFKDMISEIISKDSALYGRVLLAKVSASGFINLSPNGEVISINGDPKEALLGVLHVVRNIAGDAGERSALNSLRAYAAKRVEIKADIDEVISSFL